MKKFTYKIARDIALKSFEQVLDCMLDYSDSGYSFSNTGENFEQNFEEDLTEAGFVVTERKIRIICGHYDKIKERFEKMIRAKYYDKYAKGTLVH